MCIIASIPTPSGAILLKNRDRNYPVTLKATFLDLDGMECLIVADLLTEWIEGMNEAGICIVNSALMTGHDEKEKKKVKKGKKSKDGERILHALRYSSVEDVIEELKTYKGGIKGHTFVRGPEGVFVIEATSKHEAIVKELDPNQLYVRTNHGIFHEDAGYQKGEDLKSSQIRRELARKQLEGVTDPQKIVEKINHKFFSHESPFNMVRNTGKMKTSSQFLMVPHEKTLYIHLVQANIKGFEIKDHRPDTTTESKLKLKVI